MKNILSLLLSLFCTVSLVSQDSLTREQLQPLTYTFQVEDGQLTGPGAAFLAEAMADAQYTMLGEYHGSRRISELTSALIPIMDSLGCNTFVLEVGPVTGQILDRIASSVVDSLRVINDTYLIREEDGYVNTPIPFFEGLEDAAFLAEAKARNWKILGIDQEFFFSYQMLLDAMYDRLSPTQQASHRAIYPAASDSLAAYYQMDLSGEGDLAVLVKQSEVIQKYLERMGEEPANRAIIDAFRASIHIYWLYSQRQWFENNQTRIHYMKHQLRQQLQAANFDLSEDKLLIKMGGIHLARGFSRLGLYEVGNMLNELAEYHGNSTLNITFSNRFYEEDGEVMDILQSDSEYRQRLRDLNQMGRQDEWVVIDLRPMIKGHFYRPVEYDFNEHVEELVKRYDLLIIPPTEMEPSPNYSTE